MRLVCQCKKFRQTCRLHPKFINVGQGSAGLMHLPTPLSRYLKMNKTIADFTFAMMTAWQFGIKHSPG